MTNQELIALIKKNPIAFGCGVVALGLAVATYFRMEEIPSAEAQLAEKSTLSERYALNLTNSAQLKEQFDDMVAFNKAIDARIIRASQLGVNYQYFQKLRTETGVAVIDFSQTTPPNVAKPAKGAFLPVSFRVTVQGTYTQVLEYLRALESGAHFCRVLQTNIQANSANRTAPLTVALTLELLGIP